MVCFKATLWCVTSKPSQHILITIIWQEGKALCQTKRYLTYRKVTSCDIFGVTTKRTLATMGSDESFFSGKCKKCVWVTGRFQLSQFQLLRSQCIVPLNLVLGVQVQKHLTRLNSFRLRSKFNLTQQWDVCLLHNTWTFSNKNKNWRPFVQCSTHDMTWHSTWSKIWLSE